MRHRARKVIVVGGQYGDEGKGKIVDYLLRETGAKACVRFNGGANAGHSVYCPQGSFATHQIPSGVAYDGVANIIGPGCLIDPPKLKVEYEQLCAALGLSQLKVRVSTQAHVIQDAHVAADIANEEMSARPIGTCRTGNGPAYAAKAQRTGMTARAWVSQNLHDPVACWLDSLLVTYWQRIWDLERAQASIVFEGAHGTMLDIDHGHYPYVTSSTCIAGGAYAAGGCPPTDNDERVMVVKLHTTRVGAGPMPKLYGEDQQDAIREAAREYGTTTGRPRKIGMLDLGEVAYAARLNQPTCIAITMTDIWAGMDFPCLYTIDGRVYSFPRWQVWKDGFLSPELQEVIDTIQHYVGFPVGLVSTGRGRDDIYNLQGVDALG